MKEMHNDKQYPGETCVPKRDITIIIVIANTLTDSYVGVVDEYEEVVVQILADILTDSVTAVHSGP